MADPYAMRFLNKAAAQKRADRYSRRSPNRNYAKVEPAGSAYIVVRISSKGTRQMLCDDGRWRAWCWTTPRPETEASE